jgi:hypothetical protein
VSLPLKNKPLTGKTTTRQGFTSLGRFALIACRSGERPTPRLRNKVSAVLIGKLERLIIEHHDSADH